MENLGLRLLPGTILGISKVVRSGAAGTAMAVPLT